MDNMAEGVNRTREIIVQRNLVFVYADVFQKLGWRLAKTESASYLGNEVKLSFERPAGYVNNATLQRLQRRFEEAAGEVDAMERSIINDAARPSIILGLLGMMALLLALLLVIFTNSPVGAAFAVIGAVGCIVPVFLYHRLYRYILSSNEIPLKSSLVKFFQSERKRKR